VREAEQRVKELKVEELQIEAAPSLPPPVPEPAPPEPAPLPAAPPAAGELLIPVEGVEPGELKDTFTESRGSGRVHDAIDIMAPEGTPVFAVDDGKVAKLFKSDPGGLTIYHFDPSETHAYYYAHLDGYAPGLTEGKLIKRGEVIGYVGSTGNAIASAPHLHFAIFVLGPKKRWWEGQAINPYPILRMDQTP
jgi:murein DD-endopeptidase MepM/ murein hydrolase activator NlpD